MALLPFLAKATSGFKEEASLLLFLFLFLYPAFHYIRSREEGEEVSLVYLAPFFSDARERRKNSFLARKISSLPRLILLILRQKSCLPLPSSPALLSFPIGGGGEGGYGDEGEGVGDLEKCEIRRPKKKLAKKMLLYLLQEKVAFLTYKTTNPC